MDFGRYVGCSLIPIILEMERARGVFKVGVRCFGVVDAPVSGILGKALISLSSSVSGSE